MNTIVLSLDRYPDHAKERKTVEYINIVFTGIFTIEMILKFLALGWTNFFMSKFNFFDSFIVLSCLIDFFVFSYLESRDDLIGQKNR